MKAILNYHGFTRMIDCHESRDIYEVMIPPELTALSMDSYGMAPMTERRKYLIFYKTEMTIIDGDIVALFEFKEER